METIKESELRIGNSIKQFNYDFYEDEKWNTEDFDIVEVNLIILESISKGDDFSELFEGIPITEELLLEYGAEKRDFGFKITDYIRIIFDDSGVILECEDSFYSSNLENVKYLHQLQNLYFALTNKELKKI